MIAESILETLKAKYIGKELDIYLSQGKDKKYGSFLILTKHDFYIQTVVTVIINDVTFEQDYEGCYYAVEFEYNNKKENLNLQHILYD